MTYQFSDHQPDTMDVAITLKSSLTIPRHHAAAIFASAIEARLSRNQASFIASYMDDTYVVTVTKMQKPSVA